MGEVTRETVRFAEWTPEHGVSCSADEPFALSVRIADWTSWTPSNMGRHLSDGSLLRYCLAADAMLIH